MKDCPPGKYFCNKEKKCMPIPKGHYVGARGWLRPDPEDEDGNGNGKKSKGGKKNGNGSSHSNGSNNGNGNGGGSNGGGVSEHRLLSVQEATTLPRVNGQTMYVTFQWRGKYMSLQMFFPELKKPTKAELQDAVVKVYPGARVSHYDNVLRDPTKPILQLPDT